MKKITICLVALVALISCSKNCTHTYTYFIENTASESVQVIYNHINFIDTVAVASGETVIIFHTNHGLENCDDGPKNTSVKDDLKAFIVSKNGNESNKDFYDNTNWTFVNGNYTTTVTDSDF